jgi:hypothetical protein
LVCKLKNFHTVGAPSLTADIQKGVRERPLTPQKPIAKTVEYSCRVPHTLVWELSPDKGSHGCPTSLEVGSANVRIFFPTAEVVGHP